MKIFSTGWSEGVDGPGRRWVIYLQGCNLRCRWCANPEGLTCNGGILFYPKRGEAPHEACPFEAVAANGDSLGLDRAECTACADRPCARVNRHPAFVEAGWEMTVAEVVEGALERRSLFGASGGVTFGGGEATLQAEEILRAAAELRRNEVKTAIESNAGASGFASCINRFDLMICDLKCVSSARFEEWTGAKQGPTLANLEQAAREQGEFWLRVPLVPGFNDDPKEVEAMGAFMQQLAEKRASLRVEVIRLHHLGLPKYAALDMAYPAANIAEPSMASAQAIVEFFNKGKVQASLAK